MSKMDVFNDGRNEGLRYAYDICQKAQKNGQDPVKALGDELRFRKITNIKILVSQKEIEQASEVFKGTLIKTLSAASMIILWDKFGFGKVRLERFWDGFVEYTRSLYSTSSTWYDITDTLKDKFGIIVDLSDENILGKGDLNEGN